MVRTIIYLLLTSFCSLSVAASQVTESPVDSIFGEILLNELVISADRRAERKLEVPQRLFSFDKWSMERANVRSTADLLAESGTLSVQKSQQGGGSPVIRGFEGSRVLLMIDNVKLNNLIYRSGHLQNVIAIDQAMLSKAEILYGSSSVMYGSDALGGVVHFYTRQPQLNLWGEKRVTAHGNAFYRFGSSNKESTGHIDLNLATDKLASLTSFTYSRFGDLQSGKRKNPFLGKDSYIAREQFVERINGRDSLFANTQRNLQVGSGFSQYDLLQKFLYHPNDKVSHLLNFQLSNSTDVPRYDRLTELKKNKPKFAEWYYGPQFRLMGAYELRTNSLLGADEAGVILAYQKVKESRHNRNLNELYRSSRMEEVDVFSLSVNWIKQLGKHTLQVGADGSLNYLASTAYAEQIDTHRCDPLDTRYPDGKNYMHQFDAFVSHRWRITPELSMTDGIRLGYSALSAHFNNKQYFPFLQDEVIQNNVTYSASWGLNYLPVPTWRFAFLVSTGFRVPNIDDLGKVFDSQAGRVVVPNPHVDPEKSVNMEFNITKAINDCLSWETTLFSTYFFDAITLGTAQLNGQDSIRYDGEMSKVYANTNSRRAYLLGLSSTLRMKFLRYFTADAALNYTYGRIVTDSVHLPLDHIPPIFGRVGLSFLSADTRWDVSFFSLFNGKKLLKNYNLDGEDNLAYATTKGASGEGLPAWFTLNLKASYCFTSFLTLQAGIENLLDTEYRTFSSGINASGRNIYVTARLKL